MRRGDSSGHVTSPQLPLLSFLRTYSFSGFIVFPCLGVAGFGVFVWVARRLASLVLVRLLPLKHEYFGEVVRLIKCHKWYSSRHFQELQGLVILDTPGV